ncbi:histone-fold-containing protein [Cystobasidium minutum MCA 4210]|uniref:histone-fold-containing protein n=1 Tax=Cystobasidium minutum MCA 4210 TaxID=1397322 RepID=UPI0034CF624C|eukprot:jgi/Rhomi1/198915/gm1.7129_g
MAQDMPPSSAAPKTGKASSKGGASSSTTTAKQARKRGRPSASSVGNGSNSNAAAAPTATAAIPVPPAAATNVAESSPSSTVSTARNTLEDDSHPMQVQYIPRKNVDAHEFAEAFWRHQFGVAETVQEDFKTPELPLARVKRVMKTDPEVAMIASEVPVILEKACQIFIADLTARAYIDSPKRRTLTKADVSRAARQTDMFDFLIDILPREGVASTSNNSNHHHASNGNSRRDSLNSQM